jgi:hypothetical protein
MPRTPPPLVVRPHDPARERRGHLLAGAIWLVSLVVVAAVAAAATISDTIQIAPASICPRRSRAGSCVRTTSGG